MNTVTMSEGQLVRTIRTHLAKAEQLQGKANDHFVAAGIHIKTLKAQHDGAGGTWAQWEEKLRTQLNLGKSRASELMLIADGTKTVEGLRADTAKRVSEHRESSPLRNGETAAEPAADYQSPWDAHGKPAPEPDDMPTAEEANESYQGTLYDHACLIVDEEMSGETRQRFFAHLKRKYRQIADDAAAPTIPVAFDPLDIPPMLDRTKGAA
jgi:hypothetical protein